LEERVPEAEVNGVRIYYELEGSGEPLVLVHGSWGDARAWGLMTPALTQSHRVLAYDRRGHSRSERPDAQGSIHEDGDDLAGLLEALDVRPAHVVASSWGGNIALGLASRRPEMFLSLSCHEPPLFGLLADDPEGQELLGQSAGSLAGVGRKIADGDHEGAARQFADEVALGPGAWDNQLPVEAKEMMVRNAPTFLDELQDPDQLGAREDVLARIEVPVLLTGGSESPPVFRRVLDRLEKLIPRARRETIEGAGHVPHMTTPDRYVQVIAGERAGP
jgi:pimeloyl-ACP methyl ester carboxylesterase